MPSEWKMTGKIYDYGSCVWDTKDQNKYEILKSEILEKKS